MRPHLSVLLLSMTSLSLSAAAQTPDTHPYSRRNTFTAFAEYSNDSSHIILGSTPNRKLAAAGVQYERRLVANSHLTWSYVAELRPFLLSSDPYATFVITNSNTGPGPAQPPFAYSSSVYRCNAGTNTSSTTSTSTGITYTTTVITTCSRQHTFAQGLAPIGFRINLRPQHPLQLTFSSNGGYIFSTRPIPVANAGSFNFTFEFGGGLEYFHTPHSSVRLEYVVQHYSNHYTANQNPGVDSGFIKLTYAFGR